MIIEKNAIVTALVDAKCAVELVRREMVIVIDVRTNFDEKLRHAINCINLAIEGIVE